MYMQKIINLSNEGYGFGFLVSPGKGGGTIVQSLIPDGVAWKVSMHAYSTFRNLLRGPIYNKVCTNFVMCTSMILSDITTYCNYDSHACQLC